ncbi:MAG: DUF4860 domain-containing protein [Clostridiales Family XIII bacterium]|jgi:hypothetical protein|nr:DUF4860 domain-containing protein [Clostridiales Family XIII bacterium]
MRRYIADILIVLALFGAYAAGATLLSAIGAQVYTNEGEVISDNYDMRTGALYISEKARQNDAAGCVRLDRTAGGDALVLTENKSGKGYETWIYIHEGTLREIMIPPGGSPNVSDGQTIMPMERMDTSFEGDLLCVELRTISGEVSELKLLLRAAE